MRRHSTTIKIVTGNFFLLFSAFAVVPNSATTNCVINATNNSNGGRSGYHSPSSTDTYLPDCENPLKRELWRVFQQEDGTAYIIPRPDGLGTVYNICNGRVPVKEGIIDKANQYGLCDNDINVAAINHIDPNYGLLFVNIFHRQLHFVADGQNIQPFAPDSDILDACELREGDETLNSYCQAVKNQCNSFGECTEMMVVPSEMQVRQIVPALNELYGIPEIGDQCDPEQWSSSFSCPVAKCATSPQGCEYVRDHYIINQDRDCCAEMCFSVDSQGNKCSRAMFLQLLR